MPSWLKSDVARAHDAYCSDLGLLQVGFRLPALGRFLTAMHRDIALYRAAGDAVSVKDLKTIRAAAEQLRTALQQNAGVSPATAHLEQVTAKGPVC